MQTYSDYYFWNSWSERSACIGLGCWHTTKVATIFSNFCPAQSAEQIAGPTCHNSGGRLKMPKILTSDWLIVTASVIGHVFTASASSVSVGCIGVQWTWEESTQWV